MSSANEPPTKDDPERHLPPHHNPLPELTGEHHAEISQAAFERVHTSEDFDRLRTTFRKFAFPMTAVFVVWYFLYVLLSTYAGIRNVDPILMRLSRSLGCSPWLLWPG